MSHRFIASMGALAIVIEVALLVEVAFISGAMLEASGPEEAPELVTAWQVAPETPAQEAPGLRRRSRSVPTRPRPGRGRGPPLPPQ